MDPTQRASDDVKNQPILTFDKKLKVGKLPQDVYVRKDGEIVLACQGKDSRVLLLNASGKEKHTFNVDGFGDGQMQLDGPAGVCEDETHTYASDTYNYRIVVYDKRTRKVVRVLCGNGEGSGKNQLNYPYQVRILGKFLYVIDRYNHRVQIFSTKDWQVKHTFEDQFNEPLGLHVDDRNIFVTEAIGNCVNVFDTRTRKWVATLGGNGDYEFYIPAGVCATASHVFVSDSWNGRIQVFERNSWRLVQSVKDVRGPRGMCMRNDRLYVACWHDESVRVFKDLHAVARQERGRLAAAVRTRTRRALWVLQNEN